MRKTVLLLIFAFCLFSWAFPQQYGWTDISANMPESANLNDVQFIGEEVWITGWGDGVFYSPNGGETFQIQSLPENSGITSSVFMKSNQEGYVVTFLGDILKTDNGGTTWTTLHEPSEGLNSVHFPPNSDTGYACGTNGTVYMFDDVNITDISPSGVSTNLQSICFPVNNADGKVCGETTIARYKNNSWNNLQLYDATLFYNSIFFIDDTTGWCVGINGTIILTVDGFSWVLQTSNATTTLNDVFFINSFEGWAVGYENLLNSVDGGETWANVAISLTEGKLLRAIYFTSAHNGYVVGNSVVLKYGEVSGMGDGIETLPFEISPNPVASVVSIQSAVFSQESATIEIMDLNSRKLIEKNIRLGRDKYELDVSQLKTGIYFCTIRTQDNSSTQKLIIQK